MGERLNAYTRDSPIHSVLCADRGQDDRTQRTEVQKGEMGKMEDASVSEQVLY